MQDQQPLSAYQEAQERKRNNLVISQLSMPQPCIVGSLPIRVLELRRRYTSALRQLRDAQEADFDACNLSECLSLTNADVPVQMSQQAKQVLSACERTPTDEVELNYDPRNPFDTCPLTFTPIYR